MKRRFEENEEKISEKVFSQTLIVSVLSILICLVALSSMTYAWFTSDVSSSNNTLTSGSFQLDVSVKDENGADVVPLGVDQRGSSFKLGVGSYRVELKMTDASTVKGFCVVSVGDERKQTVGIARGNEASALHTDRLTFTLVITEQDTVVEFVSEWGVPAQPEIAQGGSFSVNSSDDNT